MLRTMKRGAGLAVAAIVVAAMFTSAAEAGTYTVYGCSTPAGQPAPLDGWIGTSSPGPPNWTGHASYCAGADPYFVMDHQLPPGASSVIWPAGSGARYTFTAPPGTTVASAVVRRRFSGSSAPVMAFRVVHRDQVREWCTLFYGCTRLDGDRTFAGIDGPSYLIEQLCGGPQNCEDSKTVTSQIRRVATTLSDAAAPSFSSPPSGTLVEPGQVLAGRVGASLPLQDDGGGLRAVRLEVDGAVVGSWSVDGNGGRCTEPYVYAVPCKLAATAVVDWDSNAVPDGDHQARLLVDDAAGNLLVHGPFQIRVRNTPRTCGDAAAGLRVTARFRRDGRRVFVRRGRAVRITGRVTANGAPVAGTSVHLIRRVQRRDAAAGPSGAVTATRANGRYTLRVARGPSRTLRLGVRASGNATRFTCSRQLDLRVRAQVSLRANPRHLGGAGTVRFAGRLRGGHIPARGKIVVLQGREAGKWRTFTATRSDRRGRFHVRYRFRGNPGRYPVRALVPDEAAYPFAPGTSPAVAVVVG
jgi:hypothetical protein